MLPCARARSLRGLEDVTELFSLLTARAATSTSIRRGNIRLIEHMTKLSGADLHLRTQVTAIGPGRHRRDKLSTVRNNLLEDTSDMMYAEFDAVILAAPLQSTDIDLSALGLHALTSLPPYEESHVTHFTTPTALSANQRALPFDLSISGDNILTTSTTTRHPDLVTLHKSTVCYLRGCLPGDDCDQCQDENLYRIHSRQRLADSDLARLIDGSEEQISWVHRCAWPHAFPQRQPGNTLLDHIEIAPRLLYLNGAENLVSSMEMSCRMGLNAANKLYYRWVPFM